MVVEIVYRMAAMPKVNFEIVVTGQTIPQVAIL